MLSSRCKAGRTRTATPVTPLSAFSLNRFCVVLPCNNTALVVLAGSISCPSPSFQPPLSLLLLFQYSCSASTPSPLAEPCCAFDWLADSRVWCGISGSLQPWTALSLRWQTRRFYLQLLRQRRSCHRSVQWTSAWSIVRRIAVRRERGQQQTTTAVCLTSQATRLPGNQSLSASITLCPTPIATLSSISSTTYSTPPPACCNPHPPPPRPSHPPHLPPSLSAPPFHRRLYSRSMCRPHG